MSNLGTLATTVGQRLGVDTSSASTRDGAAVRAFLSYRHDQMYQSFLWKDSIIEFQVPLNQAYTPTSNYMPTKAHVILPSIFQLVLGARLGCRALNVQRPMLYYRANYAEFFSSGWTHDFTVLPECVWEFDTVQTNLLLAISSQTDVGQNVTLDLLASDEISVNRSVVSLVNPTVAIPNTDRIDNFIKPVTMGTVSVSGNVGTSLGANLIAPGTTYASPYYNISTLLTQGQTYQFTAGANEVAFSINGGNFQAVVPGQVITFTYNGTSTIIQGNVTFTVTAIVQLVSVVLNSIITLQPADVSAPKCQRIQLIGTPTTVNQVNQNLFILGKRKTPPFSADSDVPGISGIDGVLIALAYYDFKQRDEAGGSPDAVAALNEAVGPKFLTATPSVPGGFLQKLIEREVVQAAYNTRIIPQDGFGPCGYWEQDSKFDIYGSP